MRWFRIQMFIAAMMLGLTASAGAYGYDFEQDDLFFRILSESEKTCEVTRRPRNSYFSKIIKIPERVEYQGDSYTVKSIGANSFIDDNGEISKIEIPESVTSIESNAFCCSIDSIFMKSICPPAISDNSIKIYYATTVYVPRGCEKVYKSAEGWKNFGAILGGTYRTFYSDGWEYEVLSFDDGICELSEINEGYKGDTLYIPEKVGGLSVVSIGKGAGVHSVNHYPYIEGLYANCIILPSTIKTVNYCAFSDFCNLQTVILSPNISNLDSSAFSDFRIFADFYISATEPPMVNEDAFDYFRGTTVTLNVPKGCAEKYKNAAPWNVFVNIKERDYGSADYDYKTFRYAGLAYKINPGNEQTCVLPGTNYSRNYSGELVVPEYAECDGQKYSVIELGRFAFSGNVDLTSVKLPNSLKLIGDYAFYNCNSLTEIEIPDNVEMICRRAFMECVNLKTVTIGKNVSIIGGKAFDILKKYYQDVRKFKIEKVYSRNPNPPLLLSEFDINYSKATLYVPKGSKELYQSADNWSYFRNIEEMDFSGGVDDVTADGDEMKVIAADGRLTVTGGDDDGPIEVYNLSGHLVYRGADRSIEMPQRGIYIVRLSGKAVKVAL